MFGKCLSKPVAIIALGLLASVANASVTYQFTALTSPSFPDFGIVSLNGSFSFTSPDFVTNATIPVASLNSCSITSPTGLVCGDMSFGQIPLFDSVGFGIPNPSGNGGLGIGYFFDTGAFTTVGTHVTTLFDETQSGLLVVSGAPENGTPVPEPATLALLGLGLAGLGFSRRNKA